MKVTNDKKGISLIVLVITIVVIIILAVAVILTIANNNPIENARKAAFQNDLSTIKDEISLYIAEKYAEKLGEYNPESFSTADLNTLSSVKNSSFKDKVAILNGKLVLVKDAFSDKEVAWASEIGIVEGEKQITPWDGTTVDTAWYDNNTSATTFEISTAEELAGLAKIVNDGTDDFKGKTINLTNNIDLNNKEWKSIGYCNFSNTDHDDDFRPFSGEFNGNYHCISNMKIAESVSQYVGLFGYVMSVPGYEATIKNVIVKNSEIKTGDESMYNGIIAGSLEGTTSGQPHAYAYIKNCASIDNYIEGTKGVSGIAGDIYDSIALNCYNSSTVVCIGSNTLPACGCSAAGICAFGVDSGQIYNCYNTGSITATNATASGIIGYPGGYIVSNCYNIGEVEGSVAGQLVGAKLYGDQIKNCYYITGKTAIGANPDFDTDNDEICNIREISLSDLKLASALEYLNQNGYNEYVQDTKGINNGYPILKWQAENM